MCELVGGLALNVISIALLFYPLSFLLLLLKCVVDLLDLRMLCVWVYGGMIIQMYFILADLPCRSPRSISIVDALHPPRRVGVCVDTWVYVWA